MATVDRDVRRDRGGFSSAPIATFRATFGFPASPISRPVKTSQSLCATGAAGRSQGSRMEGRRRDPCATAAAGGTRRERGPIVGVKLTYHSP